MASEKKRPPADFDPADAPLTEEEIKRLRPAREWLAERGFAVPEGKPGAPERKPMGRPKLDKPKVQVTLRLRPDTLERFKATGDGWQRRIGEVLDEAAEKIGKKSA